MHRTFSVFLLPVKAKQATLKRLAPKFFVHLTYFVRGEKTEFLCTENRFNFLMKKCFNVVERKKIFIENYFNFTFDNIETLNIKNIQ